MSQLSNSTKVTQQQRTSSFPKNFSHLSHVLLVVNLCVYNTQCISYYVCKHYILLCLKLYTTHNIWISLFGYLASKSIREEHVKTLKTQYAHECDENICVIGPLTKNFGLSLSPLVLFQ